MSESHSLNYLFSDDLAPLFWTPKRVAVSAWQGHIPFAHWLVHVARPRTFVELGTHSGVSYAAFCGAVAKTKSDTHCFAIDTWQGDKHSGFYGEDVFNEFREFHDRNFSSFSKILRAEFDAAAGEFEDGQIDLIHFDGLHTYEAVRHDFETWLPKLSGQAIALFHDTSERRDDFGVWRLWSELRQRYPSFEFLHNHGLGVLCVGGNAPSKVLTLCSLDSTEQVAAVRSRFEAIGREWSAREKLLTAEHNRGREIADRDVMGAEHGHEIVMREAKSVEQEKKSAELERKNAELGRKNTELAARLTALEMRTSALNAKLLDQSRSLSEIRNSTSWRMTSPLRTLSTFVRPALGSGRRATNALWLLVSGQWRGLASGLLPYYQRHVPLAVKEMVPRAIAEPLKRRIDPSGHVPSRNIHSPVSLWARFKRDLNRKSRAGSRATKRVAVFAAYSSENTIADHVVYYLSELHKVVDAIVFVADNDLPEREIGKVKHLLAHHITGRHGEYDFGSYKRGYFYARDSGILEPDSDLILCNDSCFGPVDGFENMMSRMTMEGYDFWGITESRRFCYHLQSYFLCFSPNVYRHLYFNEFMRSVKKHDNAQDVIRNYELKLTDALIKKGFRAKALVDVGAVDNLPSEKQLNIEHFPRFMVENGSPLVKVKSLTKARCNLEGMSDTLDFLKARNGRLYREILALPKAKRFLASDDVSFSIVMPTLNRVHCISDAINSALAQSHRNFELIIVDDGSTDGTGEMVRQRYAEEIASKKIVYIDEGHGGISAARNRGLRAAKNEWIAYLDSDNTIREGFLSTYAQHVVEYPDAKIFHAMFKRKGDRVTVGKEFSYPELLRGNYIDLGVFVHHKSCFETRGGFDENLRRLVDWDLILNYTEAYSPHFIAHVLMDYSADNDPSRISIKESLDPAWFHVLAKWKHQPKVSTVILSYNQRQYIAEAIESALRQRGKLDHQIIISDDGSTDGTWEIIRDYAERYPHMIRDISSAENRGISGNYQHALSAADGEFVAVLEGDDYWIDDHKLEAQVAFLLQNRDCSMVFSKLQVHNIMRDTTRTLSRQEAIKKKKLSGRDFLDHPTMNLIGTFSTCMFRKEHLVRFPPVLFENRISEIPVAFYLDNYGKIGYLDEPMTLYRQHPAGVWSSSTAADQKRSGRETRRVAKIVARDAYKHEIQRVIDERYAG